MYLAGSDQMMFARAPINLASRPTTRLGVAWTITIPL